jgi:hypothetical protein
MIFIKIFIFICIIQIINLLLYSKSNHITPIEPEAKPEKPTDNRKYLCVSWDLRTGEVIEHETE